MVNGSSRMRTALRGIGMMSPGSPKNPPPWSPRTPGLPLQRSSAKSIIQERGKEKEEATDATTLEATASCQRLSNGERSWKERRKRNRPWNMEMAAYLSRKRQGPGLRQEPWQEVRRQEPLVHWHEEPGPSRRRSGSHYFDIIVFACGTLFVKDKIQSNAAGKSIPEKHVTHTSSHLEHS